MKRSELAITTRRAVEIAIRNKRVIYIYHDQSVGYCISLVHPRSGVVCVVEP